MNTDVNRVETKCMSYGVYQIALSENPEEVIFVKVKIPNCC
jgi:hypothetical protein